MKGWKIFLIIVLLLLAAGGGYYGLLEYRNAQAENARLREVEEAQKRSELDSVEGQAKQALETKLKLNFDLEITYDKSSNTLNVIDKESDPAGGLDQSTPITQTTYVEILRRGYFLFVHGGKAIFALDEVENFVLVQKVPVFEGGIENTEDSLRFKVTKENFQKVDWAQFELKLVHQPIAAATGGYFINPKLQGAFPQAAGLLPNK